MTYPGYPLPQADWTPPAVPQCERPARPPVPHILETPRRQLTGSWAEYGLTDGTPYFYNVETGTTSWRPPGEQTPDDGELSVRRL